MKQSVYDYSYDMLQARRKVFLNISLIAGTVFLFICLFLNIVFFPVNVKSMSMETDIAKNSAVLVTPFVGVPARGDVVYVSCENEPELGFLKRLANVFSRFFTFQQLDFFPSDSSSRTIRRIAALPGDTIYMKDYILYVKSPEENTYLSEFEKSKKNYNIHIYSVPVEWDVIGLSGTMAERTLGPDEYFLLADNRIEALDSRVQGGVNISRIKGKVFMEYFPFNKIRFF